MTVSEAVEGLQVAVDWYVEVVAARPYAPYRRLSETGAVATSLAKIDEAILPSALPVEIRWLWEHWEAPSFDVIPPAGLCDPAFALDSWFVNTKELRFPRALFPVGYENRRYVAVDLTDGGSGPATVWTYEFGSDRIERVAPSMEAVFRSCVERVNTARIDGELPDPLDHDLQWYYQRLFNGTRFAAIVDRHFSLAGGTRVRRSCEDRTTWPAAWCAVE